MSPNPPTEFADAQDFLIRIVSEIGGTMGKVKIAEDRGIESLEILHLD